MSPIDSGFYLFIFLTILPLQLLVSVWFPLQYHRAVRRIKTYIRLPGLVADVLGFILILSNVAGALAFIPYGLEAYYWRFNKCPHLFSNTACIKWSVEQGVKVSG